MLFNNHTLVRECLLAVILMQAAGNPLVVTAAEASAEEIAYTKAIAARSHKIVEPLGLSDQAATAVEKLIADQYRSLREIHDSRDSSIEQASQVPDEEDRIKQLAELEQFRLHRRFIAQLSAILTPEQVDGVKNGMTYGVMPRTYAGYLKQLPDLNEEQRSMVQALLHEAREYAMDAGSSDEKHKWFRKYKGKINNYLSAAGHSL